MSAPLTLEQLTKQVAAGEIDTVLVCFPDMQGRLMGKRFQAEFFLDSHDETHSCNYLLANDIDMEPVPGYAATSWEKGYGDFTLKPDMSTLCPTPWLEGTALVLCDVLTWTQRTFKPQRIVDLATLTGAMIIALGHEHGGMFANDDSLASDLSAAGSAVGDKLWRLPLSPAYDKLIDSPIADMQNIGPREAGSITAAQFLLRFIENDTPWAHLDIAGMVWAAKPGQTWDKGATGYGTRLLDRFIRDTLNA